MKFYAGKAPLNQKDFQSWIDGIYKSGDTELDCRQFQEVLPVYLEAKIARQSLDALITQKVNTHLQHCLDCSEVYNGLKYVIMHEQSDEADTAVSTDAPIPDLTAVTPR